MRIAHIAPVRHDNPSPEIRIGGDDDVASHRGLVALGHDVRCTPPQTRRRKARLNAILPARLLARRAHVAVELYEMLNLAAAVERAPRRRHPL